MVKSPVYLDVASERGVERVSSWRDPVEHGALDTFRVVRPCIRSASLDLPWWRANVSALELRRAKEIYQFSNLSKACFRAGHETLLKTWHQLDKLLEDAILLSLSEDMV
jgi:hypothetical protein